jgi:signal transduction histidine kinase
MSATSVTTKVKAANKDAANKDGGAGVGQWLVIAGLVIVAGVLAGFYAINDYAAGTGVLVDNARANAGRFESLYRDAAEKRLDTLRFALETLAQDEEITSAFIHGDRKALAAKVAPLYKEVLHPRYGMDQLNFFTPPATVYLRADDTSVMGNDLSAVRKTVVLAGERRQMVSGMETGLGGVVALRAVLPVLDGGRVVGTMGVGDAIASLLAQAAATSGLDYALGLDRAVAERAERAPNPATDAPQGKDVFFVFSNPAVGAILRQVEFDPRSTAPVLAPVGTRTIFIKTFPLNNFSGVPTVVIATLLDLTDGFAGVRQTVAIKAAILFLLVSILGSVGVVKFRAMRAGLERVLVGQRRELDEKKATLEAAKGKLKDAEQLKRSFLANLVASLSEPLQAVAGQLQAVGPAVEAALRGTADPGPQNPEHIIDQLRSALWETNRASRHLSDYQQLELFRQGLVRIDTPLLSLHTVVTQLLQDDLAAPLRLTALEVEAQVPASLPRTRADAGLLRRALAALTIWAAQGGASGRMAISAAVDEGAWLALTLTGADFPPGGAPDEALLARLRRAVARTPATGNGETGGEAPLGLVLALVIVEFLGGSLTVPPPGSGPAGFIVRLPAVR